jgi:hypothetical protein
VDISPRLDLAYQSSVLATDDVTNPHSDTEEPEFDNWYVQARKFLGLTQVNRQLRSEFLLLHSQNVGVTLKACDYADYIADVYPSADTTLCQGYRGSIIVTHPERFSPCGVNILLLVELAERAPSLKIFLQLNNQTYLHVDEHAFNCPKFREKIHFRDSLQPVMVHCSWGINMNVTVLTLRSKPEYQLPVWGVILDPCADNRKYTPEELQVMTGLGASREWCVADLSERLQDEVWLVRK